MYVLSAGKRKTQQDISTFVNLLYDIVCYSEVSLICISIKLL